MSLSKLPGDVLRLLVASYLPPCKQPAIARLSTDFYRIVLAVRAQQTRDAVLKAGSIDRAFVEAIDDQCGAVLVTLCRDHPVRFGKYGLLPYGTLEVNEIHARRRSHHHLPLGELAESFETWRDGDSAFAATWLAANLLRPKSLDALFRGCALCSYYDRERLISLVCYEVAGLVVWCKNVAQQYVLCFTGLQTLRAIERAPPEAFAAPLIASAADDWNPMFQFIHARESQEIAFLHLLEQLLRMGVDPHTRPRPSYELPHVNETPYDYVVKACDGTLSRPWYHRLKALFNSGGTVSEMTQCVRTV